jgi:ABC-type nickel/cobalt efflux system permease component RcnA
MRFEWYFLIIAFVIIGSLLVACWLFWEKVKGCCRNFHQGPFKDIGEGEGKGKGEGEGEGEES